MELGPVIKNPPEVAKAPSQDRRSIVPCSDVRLEHIHLTDPAGEPGVFNCAHAQGTALDAPGSCLSTMAAPVVV